MDRYKYIDTEDMLPETLLNRVPFSFSKISSTMRNAS